MSEVFDKVKKKYFKRRNTRLKPYYLMLTMLSFQV
jgi:hypothetical protein